MCFIFVSEFLICLDRLQSSKFNRGMDFKYQLTVLCTALLRCFAVESIARSSIAQLREYF
jgi:hypothetical protein